MYLELQLRLPRLCSDPSSLLFLYWTMPSSWFSSSRLRPYVPIIVNLWIWCILPIFRKLYLVFSFLLLLWIRLCQKSIDQCWPQWLQVWQQHLQFTHICSTTTSFSLQLFPWQPRLSRLPSNPSTPSFLYLTMSSFSGPRLIPYVPILSISSNLDLT